MLPRCMKQQPVLPAAAGGMSTTPKRFPGHSAFKVLQKHCQDQQISFTRLFRDLFKRKDSVDSDEFARALRALAPRMSWAEAEELTNALLSNGQIVASALPQYAEQLVRHTALANDIVFPDWLTTRADFQDHFPRLQGEKEGVGPSILLVEAAARIPPRDRQPRDAETILNWLSAYRCLTHIPIARLMRLCERLRARDVDAGTTICAQGDVGDCYYVILTGEFDVIIDGIRVATLKTGQGFGEKALETGVTRSATVISRGAGTLMVAAALDYRRAVAITQLLDFQATLTVLTEQCPALAHFSHSRLRFLAAISQKLLYRPNQLVFEPDTPANMLYVVVHGSVALKRKIRIASTRGKSAGSSPRTPRSKFSVFLTLEKLGKGGVFGEDAALERQMFTYYAFAQTETLLAIIDRERAVSAFAADKGEALFRLTESRKELYMDETVLVRSYLAAAEAQAVKAQLSSETQEARTPTRPPSGKRPKSASPRLMRTHMSNSLSVDQLHNSEQVLGDTHTIMTVRMLQSAQHRRVQLKR